MSEKTRCAYVNLKNPLYIQYHDEEWGMPDAQVFRQIQQEYGSFDAYIWGFTNGKTIVEDYALRTTSPLSDQISKDLKKRGMKFVVSTIIYSYLQAMGVINGHGKECDWCG